VFDDINSSYSEPTMEIKNLSSSIYNFNVSGSTVYTISLWVNITNFPQKYTYSSIARSSKQSTRSKRTSIARFSYIGDRSFIEFGAMAPYYRNNRHVYNYKSIFNPISLGVSIGGEKYCTTVYTDYKFNTNKWYLITLQLQSDSDFSVVNQNLSVKLFINDIQENIAQVKGIAWRQNGGKNGSGGHYSLKRAIGKAAGQPGFLEVNTGVAVSYSNVQNINIKQFFNLSTLNYISYSPIKIFNTDIPNNGTNTPKLLDLKTGFYSHNSSINYGQLYIYNKIFDKTLYDNFKNKYS
jgi:hypothetical protein